MPRRILLLRHGKSDWADANLTDHDRPLKKRGRRAAERMGAHLKEQGWVPDVVLSSPAVRARDTAFLAAEAMGLPQDQVLLDPRIYLAEPLELGQVLMERGAGDGKTTLLVGHNPGLEELVRFLCGKVPDGPDGMLMPTGALAVIPCQGEGLASGCGVLEQLQRPREL